MKEYLIAAPAYAAMCNGIKVLHKLCHKLNQRGYKAYMVGGYTNPELNTPIATSLSQEHLRDLQHNGIIVYPDIVPNNPAHFTNCCKWWLGATQPPPVNQLVFAFSEAHQCITKVERNLSMIHIEDYFKEPETENRFTTCAYAGKGSGILTKQVPEIGPPEVNLSTAGAVYGCVRITAGFPAQRKDLAKLFQSSKVFYCYDNLTVMHVEARLCGTPVILMGHYVLPEIDFKKDPFTTNGIGMYDDHPDLEKLKSELPLFREAYKKVCDQSERELDVFIEETQKWNPDNIYVADPVPAWVENGFYGFPELKLWKTR